MTLRRRYQFRVRREWRAVHKEVNQVVQSFTNLYNFYVNYVRYSITARGVWIETAPGLSLFHEQRWSSFNTTLVNTYMQDDDLLSQLLELDLLSGEPNVFAL